MQTARVGGSHTLLVAQAAIVACRAAPRIGSGGEAGAGFYGSGLREFADGCKAPTRIELVYEALQASA